MTPQTRHRWRVFIGITAAIIGCSILYAFFCLMAWLTDIFNYLAWGMAPIHG